MSLIRSERQVCVATDRLTDGQIDMGRSTPLVMQIQNKYCILYVMKMYSEMRCKLLAKINILSAREL